MTYGASPEEWVQWDLELGLTADLLPLVCTPNLPIAPGSDLTSYGKIPTWLNAKGEVNGIASWTAKTTTPVQIARWMQQDYGICLQTRRVRALDVDITDPTLARNVRDLLGEWEALLEIRFPVRSRRDSSKFLILFRMEGDYPKQTLQTPAGIIEFLGTGQQCVVAGTHPEGARYEWGHDVIEPPVVTEALFRALQAELREWFGTDDWSAGRLRAARGTQAAIRLDQLDDPVVPFLVREGRVRRTSADGRVHVTCPWAHEHTTGTDDTATSYFPAGTGQYEQGHFLCLHAHCSGRTTGDFLDAIGYLADGFTDLGEDEGAAVLKAFGVEPGGGGDGADGTDTRSPIAEPRFEREPKSGKIYARLQNVVLALANPDPYTLMPLSKDTYTDMLTVTPVGQDRRPFRDTDYTEIALRLTKGGFNPIPTQMLKEAVQYVGQQHAFDSAIDWLHGLPAWDGVPRVDSFCTRYLGAEPGAYATAVSRYWWTAHAGRVLVPGIQADMAIILISGQGTGKTSALKAIVPGPEHYVELSLSDRDDDLSRLMRGKLIGELEELRGLNGRDSESIKAWISRQRETWTPKYMEFAQQFPRRLVLVGTSNQDEFLADETGNRRWLPIRVGNHQDREGIARDRDQLWAEAKVLFSAHGVCWQEAETIARGQHHEFQIQDPWGHVIEQWLDCQDVSGAKPMDKGYLTMDEVLRDAIGLEVTRIHMTEQFRAAKVLKQMGLHRTVKRVKKGLQKVWVLK